MSGSWPIGDTTPTPVTTTLLFLIRGFFIVVASIAGCTATAMGLPRSTSNQNEQFITLLESCSLNILRRHMLEMFDRHETYLE